MGPREESKTTLLYFFPRVPKGNTKLVYILLNLSLLVKGQGEVRMKGQGEVRMKVQGKVRCVEACLGMPGHVGTCPGRGHCRQAPETGRQPSRPIRSRHEALGHQPPLSPRFLPYMGGPAWAIKPFPTLTDFADSLYPADSLCFADRPPLASLLTRPREFCPGATAQ